MIESRLVFATRRKLIAKGQEETFWSDGNLLDCGDKYMTLCICQNSLNYTLKIGECCM